MLAVLITNCSAPIEENEDLIENLMTQEGGLLEYFVQNKEQHKVQVVFSRIERDSLNNPEFHTFYFNHTPSEYFYPASTVKLPASLLALEKINNLGIDGLTKETTLLIDSTFSGQSTAYTDSTSENGLPSVEHYIKKMLLVSDNDAYNRLYEFIGQGPFNKSMNEKGYIGTRISHRLSIFLSPEENSTTNAMRFVEGDSIIYSQDQVVNSTPLDFPEPTYLGKAHYSGGELISEPMDFKYKNEFPMQDQHDLLKSIFFPGTQSESERFDLTASDYEFIRKYMGMWPSETTYPDYTDHSDYYVKFVMYGDGTNPIKEGVRVFNKVGQAYGFLIDNAYVVDFDEGIEFLVSAVIYVNANETLNDGVYEYDSLGFPFFSKLGQMFYSYEREHPHPIKPDLSSLEAVFH